MKRFKTFVLADGREIYVDPAAVTAVYDKERAAKGGWQPITTTTPADAPTNGRGHVWVEQPTPATSVVAIGQTSLVVPYTAAVVLRILESTDA